MGTTRSTAAALAWLAFLMAPLLAAAPAETVAVAPGASYDGRGFAYTIALDAEQPRHRRYLLSYPSPLETALESNNTIPAEYYVPANLQPGEPGRPAVIVLHILNGSYELERTLCTVLAENGIPAVMFMLPYYGERGGAGGRQHLLNDLSLFTQCLEQALLDIRRTADVLATRPEVDAGRLGVSGISLGAILAASACGVEPRLQRAAMILGGGELQTILDTAREARGLKAALGRLTAEQRQAVEASLARVEPLGHAGALRRLASGGRLLMINAAEDEVIPPASTRALAEAAGVAGDVVWLPGLGHYTAMAALPEILSRSVAFFAADLPASIVPPPATAAAERAPLLALVEVLQQAVAMLERSPGEGRCHLLDGTATIQSAKAKEPTTYRVAFARGSGSRFSLTAEPVPEVGTLRLGNGVMPWLVGRDGTLFLGSEGHDPSAGLGPLLDAGQLLRLRVVAGAALALASAPEVFAQHLQVVDAAPEGAPERLLEFTLTHPRVKGQGRLRLQRDTLSPREISFDVAGVRGSLAVRQWAVDTISSAEMFREPSAEAVRAVPQQDLLRMMAAMLNFLMERAR